MMLDVVTSLATLGKAIRSPEMWGFLLVGEFDGKLRPGLFWRAYDREATEEDDLQNDRKVNEMLENLKENVRMGISQIIADEAREEDQENLIRKNIQVAEANKKFIAMSQKSPEGTVKELAAKHGRSISEIRKLKAEGRLHELNISAEIG